MGGTNPGQTKSKFSTCAVPKEEEEAKKQKTEALSLACTLLFFFSLYFCVCSTVS